LICLSQMKMHTTRGYWFTNMTIKKKMPLVPKSFIKMDIPMTSCLLVLDMLTFCMLDLRLFTLLIHTPLCISHVIPYVSCIQSLMWFIQESQVLIELYAFHNDSIRSFLAFHVLVGVSLLFFWNFSFIYFFSGVNLI
jgi:hypothetical protein